MRTQTIVYIHGAYSSDICWKYVSSQLNTPFLCVNYDIEQPITEIIQTISTEISNKIEDSDIILIGHSIGGVIACHVATQLQIKKVVTIATPFKGIEITPWIYSNCDIPINAMLTLFPLLNRKIQASCNFWKNVNPTNKCFMSLQEETLQFSLLNIVTEAPISILTKRTDGNVSVDSQTALSGKQNYHERKFISNHFECLLNDKIINEIKQFVSSDLS